jgi:uncharacterized membrane protein YedE/YeeE
MQKVKEINTDFEVRSLDPMHVNEEKVHRASWHNIQYVIMGVLFGIILIKSEVISWFRIQEMFRLQSFHMYGVIGSAVVVGALSVWIIKKFNIKTIMGEPIVFSDKSFNKGQVYGGVLFGFGWAMTGACPGPLFAQLGYGSTVTVFTLFMAVVGTWVYGRFRESLPQ